MNQSFAADGRVRVAVIFGGRSSEHGVSCLTARNVIDAIDSTRYEVTPIGITTDGAWVRQPWPMAEPAEAELPFVASDATPFVLEDLRHVDVVFPVLHGPWGEDGSVQGLLEMVGVRYVGSGVLASAAGMDKPFAKALFSAGGLPQLPYVTVKPGEWENDKVRARARINALGLPVFVKPARAGSSSGVGMVTDISELDAAVAEASEFDPKVIIEAAAREKRELEVGVIQRADGSVVASLVGEVVTGNSGHEFYDFTQKYIDGTASNVVPAEVPVSVAEQVRTYAIKAFNAIGAEGLARVDFFWTADGLVINEINTMPGFTSSSMFPVLWAATGIDYESLIDLLLQEALARPLGLR